MQVPDDAVQITENTVTISLKNASVVDQFRFPGGAGNNLGIAGVPATLSFEITYTKSGASREVERASADPLSPFNWEGKMWEATNSGTFSLSSNDGTFSAQGSFDSAGNFGEIGFERNGAFAEQEHAANFLGATKPTAISPTSLTPQNQHDVALAQNTQSVQESPRGPKFRGKIPIRELIH
ncbi:MAG: hypothetical protein NVS1B11_35200 [Terriglobales bacterium]